MKTAQLIVLTLFALALVSCKREGDKVSSKLFVANEGNQTITVINAETFEVLSFIKVDDIDMVMVHNIQASPNGSCVWATYNTMEDRSGFFVIDPVNETVVSKVELGTGWSVAHIVFDNSGERAFIAATDSDLVAEVNVISHEVVRKFHLGAGSGPHGLRYSQNTLYVAEMNGESIALINVATGAINHVSAAGMPVQVAVTPDNRFAFASLYVTNSIVRYTIATGVSETFALPPEALGPIQIYPAGNNQLLICDQGMLMDRPVSDKLYVMDCVSGQITAAISVGDGAHGVVSDPTGIFAFCTVRKDHSVAAVNLKSLQVECTIPVGVDPNGITYWFEGGAQP